MVRPDARQQTSPRRADAMPDRVTARSTGDTLQQNYATSTPTATRYDGSPPAFDPALDYVTMLLVIWGQNDLDNHGHGGNHHLSGTGSTVQHLEVDMPGIKTDKKRATRRKPRRNHYAKLLESKKYQPRNTKPRQEVSDE